MLPNEYADFINVYLFFWNGDIFAVLKVYAPNCRCNIYKPDEYLNADDMLIYVY